jgi:hypothetical protein
MGWFIIDLGSTIKIIQKNQTVDRFLEQDLNFAHTKNLENG